MENGSPDIAELPDRTEARSGLEFFERLLVDHADRMVWVGRPGEVARFGILHLELWEAETIYQNRDSSRFEILINRDAGTVRPHIVNGLTEAWPMGSSDLGLIEKIKRARPVNDELTERRAEKLRELLT